MDGLRGFGALAVYLHHFYTAFYSPQTEKERDAGIDVVQPPWWTIETPVASLHHGTLWVCIFFILSGFVLPLSFFKTGRPTAITGGTMRRYFRLMLPVLMILSIYYFVGRLDVMGESTYNKIKNKTFFDLIYAGVLETWYGGWSFIEPTWTLSVEMWATYLIYLIAFTGHQYRGRFFWYLAIIFFFLTMDYLGYLNLVSYKVSRPIK